MLPLWDNFWSKVEPSPNCWNWTGTRLPRGYGTLFWDGRRWYAHRLSWSVTYGLIPPTGMCVCHTCDNPSCVRPSHLFLGTQKDNLRDMIAKGRDNRTVAPKGELHYASKLTAAQVLEIRTATGTRREIAKQFRLSESYVWAIQHKTTWRHI